MTKCLVKLIGCDAHSFIWKLVCTHSQHDFAASFFFFYIFISKMNKGGFLRSWNNSDPLKPHQSVNIVFKNVHFKTAAVRDCTVEDKQNHMNDISLQLWTRQSSFFIFLLFYVWACNNKNVTYFKNNCNSSSKILSKETLWKIKGNTAQHDK